MDAPTPLPTVDLDFTFFIPRQGTIRDYETFLFSEPPLSEYITLTPPLRINGEEFHAFYECKVTTWQRLMEIESLSRSAAWVGVVRDSLPDADTSLAAPPGGSHQFPLFILESLPGSIGFDPDIHTPMNVVFACCKPCKLDVAQRRVKKGDAISICYSGRTFASGGPLKLFARDSGTPVTDVHGWFLGRRRRGLVMLHNSVLAIVYR